MKRMMRLIALVLCAVMLLSATAFAAGGQIEIKDIVLSMPGMNLDLSGLGLELAAAEKDGGAGIRVGLNAAGADAANLYACVQDNQLLIGADGVGTVYSLDLASVASQLPVEVPSQGMTFSPEDQAAIEAIGMEAMMMFSGAVTPLGQQDVDGVAYEIYNINVSADQVDNLLKKVAVLLDAHPEIFAESEYRNFTDMINKMQVRFSLEGFAAVSDNGFDAEVYLISTEKGDGERFGVGLQIAGISERDPQGDSEAIAINAQLGIGDNNGSFEPAVDIESYMLFKGGEFASLEISAAESGYESNGVYAAFSSPVLNGDDKWSLNLVALDGTAGVELACNTRNGEINFFADEDYINFQYQINGADAAFALNMDADGVNMGVNLATTVSADDGAWIIPAGTQGVDILTLTDAQMNVLKMEAMTVAMTALSKMAVANPTVAGLLGEMSF